MSAHLEDANEGAEGEIPSDAGAASGQSGREKGDDTLLEKGKYNPSLKLAYSIAKVLKSRIEEVFFFED